MVHFEMPKKIEWTPEELHKKVGQIIYLEPGDSDINEGNFIAQLWIVTNEKDEGFVWYLLQEWDVRKRKLDSSRESKGDK